MSDLEQLIKTKVSKRDFDIFLHHIQPSPSGTYMLKDTEDAMKKYNLTRERLVKIRDNLEDIAETYERQEFLYGDDYR